MYPLTPPMDLRRHISDKPEVWRVKEADCQGERFVPGELRVWISSASSLSRGCVYALCSAHEPPGDQGKSRTTLPTTFPPSTASWAPAISSSAKRAPIVCDSRRLASKPVRFSIAICRSTGLRS